MTLNSLFWADTNANDIHLLPGLVSPRLDHLLWISDTTGNVRASSPPAGVTVGFTAEFDSAPSGHGVTMSATTGEITIANPLPAGARLRSFLVTATGREVGVAIPVTTRIRVYVHEAIDRMWLTPNPLTVRQGARGMRLSVLARFTDGVIADITNWSPFDPPDPADRTFVRATGSNTPHLTWSSNSGDVGVDTRTGVLDGVTPGGGATISAARPAPAVPATATVDVDLPWNTGVPLAHVSGPGFAAMSTVRNVLFLPDGFTTAADRIAFERLVRGLVARLNTRQKTRPFDLLAGRLNYFMAWVASPQPGVTIASELDRTTTTGTQADGRPIELPSVEIGPATPWRLDHLIHEVGLPAPAADLAGSPLATKVADWQTVYGLHITAGRVSHLYNDWLDRNDRVLVNERDTAFHTQIGVRPKVDGTGSDRSVTLNKRRLGEDDLDDFLSALTDAGGGALPNVWTRGGKDEDLLVILARSSRNAGSNAFRRTGRLQALTLMDLRTHRIEMNTPGNGWDVRPDPIPADVHPDTWTTVAHELAHSWTLRDEYGGNTVLNATRIAELAGRSNAQPRAALLNGAGQLVTTNLKWRWPRIAKAAELTGNPVALGGGAYRIPVVAGQGRAFAIDDIVRLRTRPLLTAATPSVRLRVTAPAPNEVTLQILTGGVINTATYPAGSVLMVPVRGRTPPPGSSATTWSWSRPASAPASTPPTIRSTPTRSRVRSPAARRTPWPAPARGCGCPCPPRRRTFPAGPRRTRPATRPGSSGSTRTGPRPTARSSGRPGSAS